MDPAAYLRHVGLPAQGWTPTVAALGRLHRAHVDAIPFTSVTTALGRVPALDLPTLERRMVAERRGGYCLEHVTLFAAVLDAGHKRAQPIVMTTVAMVAGMVPVALSIHGDGSFSAPMGVTVIGGLIVSTALTLLIVPASFSLAVGAEAKMGPYLRRKLLTYKPGDDAADPPGRHRLQPAE